MESIEPAFDRAGEFWSGLPEARHADIAALENTIARLSSELNSRLAEILELYNVQTRQAEELRAANDEIDRLAQIIVTLQRASERETRDAAVAREKIVSLEDDKMVLRSQLDEALGRSKLLNERLHALQAAFDAKTANVVSALEQIDFLNSELGTAAAERFKLVAAVQGEKRRRNQQTSVSEERIKQSQATIEKQDMQIRHLEAVRGKMDKRIHVLESLLKSEHEVAERKIKRLSDELDGYRDLPTFGGRMFNSVADSPTGDVCKLEVYDDAPPTPNGLSE